MPETKSDTPPSTIYDVAIIGGGPAGYTAAIRGAELGLKVALIDNAPRLGGTCLHVGCIPTKALLFNAEIWDHLKNAAEFGIAGIGTPTLDWAAVLKRKDSIITKHVKGLEFLMKKHKIAVIAGTGRLTGPAQSGGAHGRCHRVGRRRQSGERREPNQGKERDSRLRFVGQNASRPPARQHGAYQHRNPLHRPGTQVADRHRCGRRGC